MAQRPQQPHIALFAHTSLALDVVKGAPYLVTTTAGCIASNKWQRPNPPYVFLQYRENTWRRVPLAEFPQEIAKANVVISTQRHEPRLKAHVGPVTPEEIE